MLHREAPEGLEVRPGGLLGQPVTEGLVPLGRRGVKSTEVKG